MANETTKVDVSANKGDAEALIAAARAYGDENIIGLERTVNWLDHHPQWATCGGDLDAYGLREPGLVFTRWHGDNFVMAPTKLGWALLIHLHPNLRGGAQSEHEKRA